MWSIQDKQLDKILHSGRNSETKEEALEGAFDFWAGGTWADLEDEEIEELREDKEDWLGFVGLEPFKHDEPIYEPRDWI